MVDIIIDALTSIMGTRVRVYYPQAVNSIYTQRGNKYTYNDGYAEDGSYDEGNDSPDYDGRFLTTGVFSERLQSDQSVDPYDGEEVFIYIKGSEYVPKNSKVLIAWADSNDNWNPDVVFVYRVLQAEGPVGLEDQLYRKLRMVPMEARFPTS